jgi:intein/homing endonuclease
MEEDIEESKKEELKQLFSDYAKKQAKEKLSDNQLQLPTGKIITFNQEQFEGVQKINSWLKNGVTFFTLAGYAGTGKSTMIKKILDGYHRGVVVSAPTHKAKKVVMDTTGEDGQTLHALLGLRPDVDLDNFNPNDPKFNPIAIPKINDYNFVIVDEASMINKELFDMIIDKTKGSNTKVLYVGDPAQIPPVGEKESAVFTDARTEYFHQLTKIERQNDTNPLAFIYDALRNNLNRLDGGFLRKSNMNDQGEGVVFTVRKPEFRQAILERYSSADFRADTDFAKVIAWKNDTIMAANKVIRTALFRDDIDVVEISDLLMGYRSISDSKQRYNIIENSADYRVVNKSNKEENSYGISGYNVTLREDLARGKHKTQDVFIIDIYDHQNLHLYAQNHDFFKEMGKANKKMWTKYYDFRRSNLLMVTIDKYSNGLYRPTSEVIVKDLDYGYAITGHKCLSENSKIQRLDGFVSLKDIQIGDIVINGGMNCNKVLNKIYTGKKRAFKLMTSFGYEIICSEDHRILNKYNEFQPLKEFNVGDYIPINRKTYVGNMDITQRDINYYLGLLVADGSYAGNRKHDKYRIDLTIGGDDQENIDFAENFYINNNIRSSTYKKNKSNCVNVYCENKAWREKLFNLGLKYVKGNDKSIPESIIIGTLQQKSNFIAGLFDGDGSIKGRGRLRFVNNSIKLIKEVQNILLEFGIISYYRKQKKAYTLTILGTSMNNYVKFISFRLNRKIETLNNFKYTIKTNCDNIPFRSEILDMVRKDLINKNTWQTKNTGIYPESFRKFPTYAKYLSYWHLENIFKLYEINNKPINQHIKDIYDNYYFYDKIIEIIEIGEEEMYDLEIENIHQFVADGFIVHNSQGSTYTHVFVLENDINENWVLKERNQIKYVALTRPSISATVLTTKIDY